MIFDVNLPGNSIQVIDEYNNTTFDSTEFGSKPSVLVVGTAFYGPTGKEVAIYNPEHACYYLGGSLFFPAIFAGKPAEVLEFIYSVSLYKGVYMVG